MDKKNTPDPQHKDHDKLQPDPHDHDQKAIERGFHKPKPENTPPKGPPPPNPPQRSDI